MTSQHINHSATGVFSSHRLIGILFVLAGLLSIASPYFMEEAGSGGRSLWVGIAFISIGVLVNSLFKGVLVDLADKRFKLYQSVLGLKSGNWESLDKAKSVRLIQITEHSTNLPNGISPTLSGNITDFHVVVISKDEQALFSMSYSSEQKAREVAKSLASGLDITFEDS